MNDVMDGSGLPDGSDREVKCCVCLEEVDYGGTSMVHCGRCGINVHVKCYGVRVGADNSTWFCKPCQYMMAPVAADAPPRMQPYCVVCPVEGGALRETNQPNVWCHVLCMHWIPELSHSLTGTLDEVLDIATLDRSRESLKCLVCGLRGGCIQCVSGRCARAFHVICAMRSPSTSIFTGYNNDNQQVYHCKTHLSDIATFKYEMVDTLWRTSPLLKTFADEPRDGSGKCRVCHNKVPEVQLERHETQCMIAWLPKEASRLRKKKMAELGIEPTVIDYAWRADGMETGEEGRNSMHASSGKHGSSSKRSKNRKQGAAMRPCPQCGDRVRETQMMGHMRSRCRKSRESSAPLRAKNSSKMKRKGNTPAASNVLDVNQDEPAPSVDMSDVLFATWPGQNTGRFLDSTSFWRIMRTNFFNSKALLKKPVGQLCKTLCGAKLEDMGNLGKKIGAHDLLRCSDTVLFERLTDPEQSLALKSIVHRCDYVMRNSRMRCMDDLYANLAVSIKHCSPAQFPELSLSQTPASGVKDIRVLFKNPCGESADCHFGIQFDRSTVNGENDNGNAGEVWSRFHHDALSTLVGASLESNKLPLRKGSDMWVSLHGFEEKREEIDLTANDAVIRQEDELTPEVNLLVDKLREQMHHNRHRMRSVSRKTQLEELREEAFQKRMDITEAYYNEYALWKALCKCLLVGYKEFWRVDSVKAQEETNSDKNDADSEEAVDDGTCVVCFDGSSPESNPIIFCDRCDLAVHLHCYGMKNVPTNEFYCDRCRLEDEGRDPGTDVYCQLCPLRDGAFKRTSEGKWVHVVCALWCPGVWISNLQTLSDITLVQSNQAMRFVDTVAELNELLKSPADQHKLGGLTKSVECLSHGSLCQYCRVACGRTIRCCHKGCSTSFHPLCGWFEGLPMTVKVTENGFIYSGGGSGLSFTMLCCEHLPSDYSSELRVSQRKNRRRFRIDSFVAKQSMHENQVPNQDFEDRESGLTDQEICAACFEFASPASNVVNSGAQLNKRQLMMRCQYCNTFIHPACCLSEIDSVSDLFNSNWICERCTQVDGRSIATNCIVCDRSADYMMPCIDPASLVTNSPRTKQAGLKGQAQLQLMKQAHLQAALSPGQTGVLVSSNSTSGDKWIHVFCAKMTKAKIWRRNQMLCASPPATTGDSSGRCDVCQTRGKNVLRCQHCSKRYHPTCAARDRHFIRRSNKAEWKVYCASHPPRDAVFDEKRQTWFTAEALGHLQELRHLLERGRMIVEMARQRDRQKKRVLNLCTVRKMELSIEMLLKKRPTPAMKTTFMDFTGEEMVDIPKRTATPKKSPRTEATTVFSRLHQNSQRENSDSERDGISEKLVDSNGPVKAGSSRKRRRLRSNDEGTDPTESETRRSSRRVRHRGNHGGDDDKLGGQASTPRQRSINDVLMGSGGHNGRRANPRGKLSDSVDKERFVEALFSATKPEDFDEVVAAAFPTLAEPE